MKMCLAKVMFTKLAPSPIVTKADGDKRWWCALVLQGMNHLLSK